MLVSFFCGFLFLSEDDILFFLKIKKQGVVLHLRLLGFYLSL